MTVDALEFLRDQNPVPHGGTAPPMDRVLAQIEAAAGPGRPGGSRNTRRRSWTGMLVPALAVAATLAVLAAVVVLAVTHRAAPPAHLPPATRKTPELGSVPSPGSLMPHGGMPGVVSVNGAASPSTDDALIFFGQCQPCHRNGAGPNTVGHFWLAATTDRGTSWHVASTSLSLTMFAFSGRDGWAEGIGSDHAARFFATHDGGRSWHVASSAAPAPGGVGDVSTAGREVWSLGSPCAGSTCTDVILRAAASSDHLSATPAQPPLHDSTNVSIVAAGRNTAYALPDGVGSAYGARVYATHDGGRSWQAGANPCPHSFGRLYRAGDALWALCTPVRGPIQLRRSTDGGGEWTTTSAKLAGLQIQPASAQVVWAIGAGGRVLRTSDGGRSWSQVWYPGHAEPSVLAGSTPAGLNRGWNTVLSVQSPTTATVIVVVTRGHVDGHAAQTDFVTYRTTDGGHTWRPTAVRLPAG